MRLSEYASTRKTRGSYKMPRSVQQSIPIDRIYADGVWQSENVFSLMWQISDINYAMQSDAAKQNILTQLGTVYAGIPADCWMQVCIVSQRMDEKAFARDVLYHRENDGFDALRAERNRQIKANARENGNVVQHKYIIVSTNKPGVKEARERFVQVQGHLLSAFSALECAVTPLDNRARLEVLHKFFRISEEGRFNFEFDNCAKLGQDFRDSIAPDCIRFCKKHIEIEDFYAKCMTISEYPQQLDDKFISALLQQVPYIVLSIDIEPVETEDAFKEIDNAQMKTDAEKVRFNKKTVENLDFTSSVPQRTQEQDRIIASIRKEMTENDQQMFLSLLTVTYFADTLEDLALETDALKTTAANYNCRLRALQELVGGDIECCRPWRDSVCVICNDSGKIDGLPPNRLYGHTDFLAGSFVVCGNGGEDFISLTDRQVFLYERLYHNPVVFLPTPHGLLPMKCTPEQYEQFQRDGNKLKIKPIDHGDR